MQLALFEPDIPQNTGTLMRLCACLGVRLHVIEPCGFILDDHRLRRAVMDYTAGLSWQRHLDWAAFSRWRQEAGGRLVLLTTHAEKSHIDFSFQATDILLLGRESAGVPEAVQRAADERLRIPMMPELRSLNVALAGALVLGEALRQTGEYPSG